MAEYSLREKKFAKTKLRLTKQFMGQLAKTRFEDINIKEVCEEVEVSEATFYNYFTKKADVLHYHKALMNLRLQWYIDAGRPYENPLEAIRKVFDVFADSFTNQRQIYEIISIYLREGCEHHEFPEITDAEKYYKYPELDGIEKFNNKPLEEVFRYWIDIAGKEGVLPKGAKVGDILIALFSTFIGTIVILEKKQFKELKKYYNRQLDIVWKGIGGK